MQIWKPGLAAVVLVSLTACSTDGQFRKYYGKPVQYVILEHGEPANMVQMPGNEMAFQWQLEADTVASSVIGDKPPFIDMTQCKYTVFTSWDEVQEAWVVYNHEDVPFGC
ncbi:MAG: hypothetical protein CME88_07355 [Hirschia sp.]|nr:hypothetical protein [Hirschia sp.]MBF18178.1 hypothetical protein [Hirschia sp.]